MQTMKNPEINAEVLSKLSDFENLEAVLPSEEWKHAMTKKLISVKPISGSASISTKYKVLVVLAILINVGIVWSSIKIDSQTDHSKKSEYQIISKEFLVNPVSINN
jgi:hypothetical protein